MNYTILNNEKPAQADVLAIAAPLQQFNLQAGPAPNARAVTLQLVDEEGKTVGGLFAKIGYEHLFVEFLVVPEQARGTGLGRELMMRAETIAQEQNCTGAWLQTLDFQARGFYEKIGYTVFAQLDNFPAGGTLYFMRKSLEPAGPATPESAASSGSHSK